MLLSRSALPIPPPSPLSASPTYDNDRSPAIRRGSKWRRGRGRTSKRMEWTAAAESDSLCAADADFQVLVTPPSPAVSAKSPYPSEMENRIEGRRRSLSAFLLFFFPGLKVTPESIFSLAIFCEKEIWEGRFLLVRLKGNRHLRRPIHLGLVPCRTLSSSFSPSPPYPFREGRRTGY